MFLGLGPPPPAPSWGALRDRITLHQSDLLDQRSLTDAPWLAIWPGVMIFVTVFSFNLLGDGLRDALDPRSR